MIHYFITAGIFGIILGIFTGLFPGIHINLIALLLVSFSAVLLSHLDPMILVVFIIAMTITHSFLDFIPSIFLGAPSEETALSILPGHRMLLEGKGYAAVRLASIGCFIGIVLLLIVTPLFVFILPAVYDYIRIYMAYILIAASLFLFLREKEKIWAFFLFMLSGVLGIAALNLPVNQPLFPLLTGLFGTSMLIKSISDKVELSKQDFK